jgi:type II secretory pathway pseudopilin PulG
MIELMVATAIASLVMTAVLTFHVHQRASFKGAVETLDAFSNASEALSLVVEAARSAWVPVHGSGRRPGVLSAAAFACAGAPVTGPWDQPACAPAVSQFGDGVQFTHPAGSPCRLSDGEVGPVASRWFVRTFPATGVPELYCLGQGERASQPMVPGIDAFRVWHAARPVVARLGISAATTVLVPMLEGLALCVVARGRVGGPAAPYLDCDGKRVAPAGRSNPVVLQGWVAIRSGDTAWH